MATEAPESIRGSAPTCYTRRMRGALALYALLVAACGSEPQRATSTTNPAAMLERFELPEESAEDWTDAPLDLRAIRLHPDQHVEQERICDIARVSPPHPVRLEHPRYADGMRAAMEVRCQSESGAAWGTLLFPAAALDQAETLEPGQRLRVKVLGAVPTELEYIVVVGDAPLLRSDRWAFEPIPIGNALRDLQTGRTYECSVAWASDFEHLEHPARPWRRLVHCAHSLGDDPVDVSFSPTQEEELLAVRRGAQVVLRIQSLDMGRGGYPLAELESLAAR